MKINSINFVNANNVYKNQTVWAQTKKTKKSDSIEISDLGKYLNKVDKSDKEVNIDKINDIKKRIENGTYSVDSKDLAKKIIERMKGDSN